MILIWMALGYNLSLDIDFVKVIFTGKIVNFQGKQILL